MIHPNFVFLGLLLNLIGGLSYLIDTVKGKVKPNRVSWLLWAIAPLIAFFAETKQGVGMASLMTFIVGFNPLLIFIASFVNKKSEWKIGRIDIVCGVLSVIGLILWLITKVGNLAIIFCILADGLASIPTVIKSYHAPESENYRVYLFGGISAFITLLTLSIWNLAHFGFPLYILLINSLITTLIVFKPGERISVKP